MESHAEPLSVLGSVSQGRQAGRGRAGAGAAHTQRRAREPLQRRGLLLLDALHAVLRHCPRWVTGGSVCLLPCCARRQTALRCGSIAAAASPLGGWFGFFNAVHILGLCYFCSPLFFPCANLKQINKPATSAGIRLLLKSGWDENPASWDHVSSFTLPPHPLPGGLQC